MGNIVPEPASSFHSYRQQVITRYSRDLAAQGAPRCLLQREWLNSRGVIFRFDRRAIEIRIMDEQECIKADVALSCFLRACLRGLMSQDFSSMPRLQLIQDMASVIRDGLAAQVQHPCGPMAKHVCQSLLEIAEKYAFPEERRYLPFVRRRIDSGCLSDVLRRDVKKKAQRTTMHEAIVSIYSRLIQRLQRNEMYF